MEKPAGRVAVFASFAVVLAVWCVDASAQSWAEKMFTTTSHDFRSVGRGAKADFRFEFRNLYEEDVRVAAVRTSCGCTTPTLTTKLLRTHETGAVVATLNTNSFIGNKSAVITVVFDKPYYAEVQLRVSGYIRTDITFDPPEVSFEELAPGQTNEREIVITHRGNSNWRITDVRSHCNHLQVQLGPAETIAAAGVAPTLVRYRMSVKLRDTMPEGDIQERLTLVSNDKAFPTTEMAVSGRIRPTLSVAPAAVSLGRLQAGGAAEQRLVISGESPFSIRDIVCSDERFSFDVPEGSKKLHFVKLMFKAVDDRPISLRIRIETDLPGGRSATFVVTGSVESDVRETAERAPQGAIR